MNSNLFESSQIRVIPSSQIRNRFFRRGVPPSHDRGRERPSASAVTRSEAALHGAHDSPGHVSTGPYGRWAIAQRFSAGSALRPPGRVAGVPRAPETPTSGPQCYEFTPALHHSRPLG